MLLLLSYPLVYILLQSYYYSLSLGQSLSLLPKNVFPVIFAL
jgi:hypothetical protein